MGVIALIDARRVVENTLRHLGAWQDPPAGLSPQVATLPYTYEPCGNLDRMSEELPEQTKLAGSRESDEWGGVGNDNHSLRRAAVSRSSARSSAV